ncbi:MAG: JAB domain-containing protein [Bryobacterales bacterium]
MHGLMALDRLTPPALAERADIALPDATRLAAAFELGRRLHITRAKKPKRLRTARDVAQFFHPRLGPLVHEELWIAALDARDGIRGVRMISRGGLLRQTVTIADVLRAALEMAAVKFALAHNHPSGTPDPSEDDIELTSGVERAGHDIGIEMTHHVVVTPGHHWAAIMGLVRKPLF